MSLFAEPPAEITVGPKIKTGHGDAYKVTRADQYLGYVQTDGEGWRGMAWGVLSGHLETQEEAVTWLLTAKES